jgi:hypothetical protein
MKEQPMNKPEAVLTEIESAFIAFCSSQGWPLDKLPNSSGNAIGGGIYSDDITRAAWNWECSAIRTVTQDRILAKLAEKAEPVDMVLYCPKCGTQHIDAPADLCAECPGLDCMCVRQRERWTNPPHKSHLCQNKACGHIWRPSDTPTNGVERIASGKDADTAPPTTAEVNVIDLADGTKLVRDMIGWAVVRDTTVLRYLDQFEREFVDGALRAAIEAHKGKV